MVSLSFFERLNFRKNLSQHNAAFPQLNKNFRTYDGQCNNEIHTMWGASETHFRRLLPPIYENGFNMPVGWDPNKLYFGYRKPNARSVSRKVALLGSHKDCIQFVELNVLYFRFLELTVSLRTKRIRQC